MRPVLLSRCRPRIVRLAFCVLFTSVSQPGWAATRHALVIGNAAYPQPLVNPVNDARAITQRLRALGFDVELKQDATREDIAAASEAFSIRARGADVALIYYAGHGAQAQNTSYLLPIGASVDRLSTASIVGQGLSVERITGDLQRAGARVGVLILDACRESYERGQTPLTQPLQGFAQHRPPQGVVVAYSTAPGARARDYWSPEVRNSPYTAALVESLEVPGLPLGDLFAQVAERVSLVTQDTQKPYATFGETSVRLVLNDPSQPSPDAVQPMIASATPPSNAPSEKYGDSRNSRGGGRSWPGHVLQDLNYEIGVTIARRPFPRQELEKRAAAGDVVAQTALGRGLADAKRNTPEDAALGRRWLEQAATRGFPVAQTDLAELLIIAGDSESLARASALLDTATDAGYAPAHAYKADVALRTGGGRREVVRHLMDSFSGTMQDYQGAVQETMEQLQSYRR